MHERSTTPLCTEAPADRTASPSPIPCAFIARRPSFERDDRAVLASLVADIGPLPDSVGWLAQLLNCSRRTASTYRDSLVHDHIVRRADGWLVVDHGFAAWVERARADLEARGLRFQFDALPMAALAWHLSTAELRATAIVFGEAVGKLANRKGCRTDAERAALARVARRLVVAARRRLVVNGCTVATQRIPFQFAGGVAEKQLVRIALPADRAGRRELLKRPAVLSARSKVAAVAAAEAGRRRGGGELRDTTSGRWTAAGPSATKEQTPSATAVALPIAPSEGDTPSPRSADRPEDGPSSLGGKDGSESERRRAFALAELQAAAQQGENVVDVLMQQAAAERADEPTTPAGREQRTREQATKLLADTGRVDRAVAEGQGAEILAAFGVFDRCDRVPRHKAARILDGRRHDLARMVAHTAGSPSAGAAVIVAIGASVVRDAQNNTLSAVGAVLRKRLDRYVASADLAREAGPFATWSPKAITEVFTGTRPMPRGRGEQRAAPQPRDHSDHPAAIEARRQIEEFAHAGNWRMVDYALGRGVARENRWTIAMVRDWTGIPEQHIAEQVAAERAAAAARRATA